MTLTEFLYARIAEDEEMAVTVREVGRERHGRDYEGDVNGLGFDDVGTVLATPARLLAECRAKRRTLEEYHEAYGGAVDGLGQVVLFLAAVYADHPDYQQEWAP